MRSSHQARDVGHRFLEFKIRVHASPVSQLDLHLDNKNFDQQRLAVFRMLKSLDTSHQAPRTQRSALTSWLRQTLVRS